MAAPDTFDPKDIFPLKRSGSGKNPQHLSGDRYQCGWLANQRRIGKYCPSDGSWNIDSIRRPTGSRIDSPPATSTTGTRVMFLRSPLPPHIWAHGWPSAWPKERGRSSFYQYWPATRRVGEKEELKAFTTAGFFGSEFGPMNLPYPEQAVKSVQPPQGMEPGRFSNRYRQFKKLLDQNPNRELMSDFQLESMLRSMESAHRLLQSRKRTPLTSLEPKESYVKYGDTRFGRGCLLLAA